MANPSHSMIVDDPRHCFFSSTTSQLFHSPRLLGVDWNNIILFCNCQALMLGISFVHNFFSGCSTCYLFEFEQQANTYNQPFEKRNVCKPRESLFFFVKLLSFEFQGCQTASDASALKWPLSERLAGPEEGGSISLRQSKYYFRISRRSLTMRGIFVAIKFISSSLAHKGDEMNGRRNH